LKKPAALWQLKLVVSYNGLWYNKK
jgi:hypothetical protein